MSQLTVSKLAEQVGTSADTVRYYERRGLLDSPQPPAYARTRICKERHSHWPL